MLAALATAARRCGGRAAQHAVQGRRGGVHHPQLRRLHAGDRAGLSGLRLPGHAVRSGHRRPGARRSAARTVREQAGDAATGPGGLGHRPGRLLAGRGGRPSGRLGGAVGCGATRRRLRSHLHLGHHRPPQGSGGDARGVAPHVRHVVLHRRARCGRPLPRRQPLLPHVRVQGGHSRLPHGRRHRGARAGLRPRRGHGTHRERAHQRAARAADALPDVAGGPPTAPTTT